MRSILRIPFPTQPDLAATMDIQIPALAWRPRSDTGTRWYRMVDVDGTRVEVEVAEGRRALVFFSDVADTHVDALQAQLTNMFPRQVANLTLTSHEVLKQMWQRFQGVVVMGAEPFESLLITVLSQNRTGEIVRAVYPRLAMALHPLTPSAIASTPSEELADLIRPAGPYKANRLVELGARVADLGLDRFNDIVRGPAEEARSFLESLPGVAHKTAACVLAFATQGNSTIPVDTHLFRVAARLGLTTHEGRNTPRVRDTIVADLLAHGADIVPAHFLFLLIGRTTCVSGTPRCDTCFLHQVCPVPATTHPEVP